MKQLQKTLVAGAVLSALATFAHAQAQSSTQPPSSPTTRDAKALPVVTVTSTPFGTAESEQILAPAKVLAGDELRDKLGSSLGDTLSHELGVSSSAFGAGAARPVIRGLEGARVKVLENGMNVADVSGLSNDHAVATDGPTARQIEILRGPAALLYGSGAIGGLVNVVNERIPTVLETRPSGEVSARYSTVEKAKNGAFSIDASAGNIAVHADASVRNAADYRIPGAAIPGEPAPAGGRLPWSFTRQQAAGFGASLVADWGHVGASVGSLTNLYGVPTEEGSQIDMEQMRYDLDGLIKLKGALLEQIKFKAGHTDYKHSELDHAREPLTRFTNRATEARFEAAHREIGGWHGSFGLQADETRFSALSLEGGPDTVPRTKSTSTAVFLVEEHDFAGGKVNAGLRLEEVKRTPDRGRARSFGLTSWSVGGIWPVLGDVSFGVTGSIAQRAPTPDELYSAGPHESTATFDIGNENFTRETSRNLELTLQKDKGLWRWKANAYLNRIRDFVYGEVTDVLLDEEGNAGGDLRQRIFRQADARIHGLEAELGYNQHREGWSWRVFGDTSRGRLVNAGSLPLQPATRFGLDLLWREGDWRAGVSAVRALRQERLASFETTPTPGYTLVDASLAWTQKLGDGVNLTWFVQGKNLLDQTIRMSTSVIKDMAPLPGRSLVLGVRSRF